MKPNLWALLVPFLLGLTMTFPVRSEDVSDLPADGWLRWHAPALAKAASWCCIDWQQGEARAVPCHLERKAGGFSSVERPAGATGTLQVLVKYEAGHARELRVYGSACPVVPKTSISELGELTSSVSIERLRALIPDTSASKTATVDPEMLIAAVAAHDDPAAMRVLRSTLRHSDPDWRRRTMFWATQLRAVEGRDLVLSGLAQEPDPELRKHGVFCLSQLPEALAARTLIGLVSDQAAERRLRKEAMFWLAQLESPEATRFLDSVLH